MKKKRKKTYLRQRLLVLARDAQVVERVGQRPAHQKLHRQVVDALRVRVLEVHVRVVPRLDQPVAQRVAGGQVRFQVVEAVARARERVLDVLDDALLDREDVGLGVGVHEVGEELLLGRGGRRAVAERRRRRALGRGARERARVGARERGAPGGLRGHDGLEGAGQGLDARRVGELLAVEL